MEPQNIDIYIYILLLFFVGTMIIDILQLRFFVINIFAAHSAGV